MENIFYSGWQSLVRTFILIILIYILIVFFLRAFGKRSLSKMNAFDFIVTIALGSCLPTVALNKNVSLADGALVFLLLLSLQFLLPNCQSTIKNKENNYLRSDPLAL